MDRSFHEKLIRLFPRSETQRKATEELKTSLKFQTDTARKSETGWKLQCDQTILRGIRNSKLTKNRLHDVRKPFIVMM